MFSASADLYDLIYSGFKDYSAEAETIAAIIRQEHPDARTILDVACGTGEHGRLLTEVHGFEVDGLDLDPGFVAIARRKLPRGTVYEADMISFALPRRYDAIVCLFSSIGYVRTLENVRRTLEQMRGHLAGDGVMLIEPWFPPERMQSGHVSLTTAESEGLSVARMSHTEVDGRISRLRFEYLVGRHAGIEHLSETHELGLFTSAEMLTAFAQAGLRATHDPKGPHGRGLYVARAA